jgi:hypothetical protein
MTVLTLVMCFTVCGLVQAEPTHHSYHRSVLYPQQGPEDYVIPAPAAWAGVWRSEAVISFCGFGEFQRYTIEDTVCTGDPIFLFAEIGDHIECTGSIDDNSVDISCSGVRDLTPTCTEYYSQEFSGTLNGDNAEFMVTVSLAYEGTDCFGAEDFCTETVTTATRIADEPSGCTTTSAENVNWGTLKTLYR